MIPEAQLTRVSRIKLMRTLGRPLEDVSELKNIPEEHVQLIYKNGYWDKIKGDELPGGVDFCVFDWAVNSGPGRAAKALQKIVMVSQDGAIGPKTLIAVSEMTPTEIIENTTKQRIEFYKELGTFDTFGRGWLRRAKETRDFALDMI